MDLKDLISYFDVMNNNQRFYCNKNSDNDISGILYFSEEKFKKNSNFLENNINDKLYIKKNKENNIKINADNFKNFNYYIRHYIDFDKYNFSKSYNNITSCILNIINYNNINGINLFFKKLLKEYDIYNLFNTYNYKKLIKKDILRNLIIHHEDHKKIMKQLFADYLNLNIIIFSNDKMKTYYKNQVYEKFRPTILIYKYNHKYYYLSDKKDNNKLFLSNDDINNILLVKNINDSIINYKSNKTIETEKKVETIETKTNVKKVETIKKINYSKLSVKELRELCLKKNIPIKEKRDNKLKYILKKDLIKLLSI